FNLRYDTGGCSESGLDAGCGAGRANGFLQQLLLFEAEVRTRDGALETSCRVHALRDALELDIEWRGGTPLTLELELERRPVPLLEEDPVAGQIVNGSWASVRSTHDVRRAKRTVDAAPKSECKAEAYSGGAKLTHRLPNLTYTIAV